MSEQTALVAEQALRLPPEERVELIELLQSSLETPCDGEITADHLREVKARIAAIERGEMKVMPLEEALEAARKKITR